MVESSCGAVVETEDGLVDCSECRRGDVRSGDECKSELTTAETTVDCAGSTCGATAPVDTPEVSLALGTPLGEDFMSREGDCLPSSSSPGKEPCAGEAAGDSFRNCVEICSSASAAFQDKCDVFVLDVTAEVACVVAFWLKAREKKECWELSGRLNRTLKVEISGTTNV